MSVEIVDSDSKNGPSVVSQNLCSNESATMKTSEKSRKHRICPIFLPKSSRERTSPKKEDTATKKLNTKRSKSSPTKETSEIIDIPEGNLDESPSKKQRPSKKDIMTTPDFFLTKAEREEKRRRLQKRPEPVIDISSSPPHKTKQAHRVPPLFVKMSVRKQMLIDSAETSFTPSISWRAIEFPTWPPVITDADRHFDTSFSCPLPEHISLPLLDDILPSFLGSLPAIPTPAISLLSDSDSDEEVADFPPLKPPSPAVQRFLTPLTNDISRVLRFAARLRTQLPQSRGEMWCRWESTAGLEVWWRDEDTAPAVSRLTAWLARWESPRESDSDDDWCVSSPSDSRAFLLAGGEGKSSLAAGAAITAGFRVLEVNNADASFGGVAAQLREATQSRGVPTKTPAGHAASLLLIDDIDANAPMAQPTLPLAPLFARTATDFLATETGIPAGFVRSVRQLAQRSKCPLVLTASRANSEIAAIAKNSAVLTDWHPRGTVLHLAAVLVARHRLIPAEQLIDIAMQNRYDFRQAVSTLQLFRGKPMSSVREAVPREGYRRYASLLCWPLVPRGTLWRTEIEPISLLEDENTDSFVDGNFLRFFSQLHPERCFHDFPVSTIELGCLRPSILDSRGGTVQLAGSGLAGVSQVLLVGCASGAMTLEVMRQEDDRLELRIPAVEPGLYHVTLWGVSSGKALLVHAACEDSDDAFEESPVWRRNGFVSLHALFDDGIEDDDVHRDVIDVHPSVISDKVHPNIIGGGNQKEKCGEEHQPIHGDAMMGERRENEDTKTNANMETLNSVSQNDETHPIIHVTEMDTAANKPRLDDDATLLLSLADFYHTQALIAPLAQPPPQRFLHFRDDQFHQGRFAHPSLAPTWRDMHRAISRENYAIHLPASFPWEPPSLLTLEDQIMWRNAHRIHRERIQEAMRHLPGYETLFDTGTSAGDALLSRVQLLQRLAYMDLYHGAKSRRGLRYDIFEKLTETVDRSILDDVVNVLVDTAAFERACDESERELYWPPHAQR